MTAEKIIELIKAGENIRLEFKRCGNGFEKDVYETVCAFSNRFGGDILCGVLDNGKINGIPENAIPSMLKNFQTIISNPEVFSPSLFIEPEVIAIEEKKILHIHVPISSEIHSFKKQIYDRNGESDIIIKSTSKIAEIAIRKQNIFTEQRKNFHRKPLPCNKSM